MKRYIKSVDTSNIPEENKHGDCFVQALNQFMKDPEHTTVVHGVVTGRGAIEGLQYCHAWAEVGDEVIDNTLPESLRRLPQDAYYRLANVVFTKKYGYREVLENVVNYETYGPWDKAFEGYP